MMTSVCPAAECSEGEKNIQVIIEKEDWRKRIFSDRETAHCVHRTFGEARPLSNERRETVQKSGGKPNERRTSSLPLLEASERAVLFFRCCPRFKSGPRYVLCTCITLKVTHTHSLS